MKADKIFFNGNILTMDQKNTEVECLAIKDGKIAFAGSKEEGEEYQGDKTEAIDLKGRSLIPGFIDSHLHMGVLGMNCSAIDCRYPYVKNIKNIKEKIRGRVETASPEMWIRGWGYDHSKLKEGRHPNRQDLDQVAPDNPVMITRTCAHISTFNSKGLEVANINKDTPEIEGGVIERDNEGQPLGVMKENAHMFMMKVAMPTEEELMHAFRLANDILIREGITSILSYPAMPLAEQLVHQRYVHPGPLVLGTAPLKSPTPTADRDRTVSRRSEPSSRTSLMGEQPNPWDLLQPQDETSRHRGAKHRRRCGLLGGISLLSPG